MSEAPKKIWIDPDYLEDETDCVSKVKVLDRDTQYIRADIVEEIRDWLWVFKEHNRLYFGDNHSTVIQARDALKRLEEI